MIINENLETNEIKIKKYIPFVEKQVLVQRVVDLCLDFDQDTNMVKVNFFNKKLSIDSQIILMYTDLEFAEEDFIKQYDFLVENNYFDYIFSQINSSELDMIYEAVEHEIEQAIQLNNSIEGILAKGINKIVAKLPNDKQLKSLSKSLVKDINKLDWDRLPILKQMFDTANGK
jgi:hypothetical protein